MNSLSIICSLSIVSLFLSFSCTKIAKNSRTNTDTTTNLTLYIAGNNGANPVLWKNGTVDTLSSTYGTANQITISGNDVYVAGICQENLNYNFQDTVFNGLIVGQYAYWKNGIQDNIGSPSFPSFGASISVSGDNVYYANGFAWENGIMITSPDSLQARAVFTAGNDVYIAGYDSALDVVYWKNGVMNIVSLFQGHCCAVPLVSCICVSGNDVYVGGMYNRGVYWKNGTANYMQYTSNGSFIPILNSIFVSGNDVYTTGGLVGIGLGAAYWKNGTENDLQITGGTNENTKYFTTSIFLSGSDVYVSGYSMTFTSHSTVELDSALYWKNGQEIKLSSGGQANSIYVH